MIPESIVLVDEYSEVFILRIYAVKVFIILRIFCGE